MFFLLSAFNHVILHSLFAWYKLLSDFFCQDELRQQKEEEMDDYCSQVFVVLGIMAFALFLGG